MGTYTEYNGAVKAIAVGAQVITFTPSDLSNSGILAYHLATRETAGVNDFSTITRIRVKASGSTIYDLTGPQLNAVLRATSPANRTVTATDHIFTIPFQVMRPFGFDRLANWRTAVQFPAGAQPTVEVTMTGGSVGQMLCGWTWTDEPALFYPRLLSSALNIAANSNSARYNLNLGGEIIGVVTPTDGVAEFRLVLSGRVIHHMPGEDFAPGGWLQNGLIQEYYRRFTEDAIVSAGVPNDDPLYIPVQAGLPAAEGVSYLEYYTAAAWSGVQNEAVLHELIPVS